MPSGRQQCPSARTRSLKTRGWAWAVLGGTGKAQRGLKGEHQLLKNLTLSAQWVTKFMINCVVLSLHGQLCALIVPGAITSSSGTTLKGENHASFQWLELLQGKWGTEAQEPPLKIPRGYSMYLEQIYEKCVPRDSLCPESDVLASWVATVTSAWP